MGLENMRYLSKDPAVPQEFRELLQAIGIEILADDQLLEVLLSWINQLPEICQDPSGLLRELEDMSHRIGLSVADLVADPDSSPDFLVLQVREWTLYMVGLCLLVSQGKLGEFNAEDPKWTDLGRSIPELHLMLAAHGQGEGDSDGVMQVADRWMNCRQAYQEIMNSL